MLKDTADCPDGDPILHIEINEPKAAVVICLLVTCLSGHSRYNDNEIPPLGFRGNS
jgi:hypothetical protein